MNSNVYRFDIKEQLDEFYKDVVALKNHNYRIDVILGMIISTYKRDSTEAVNNLGRFCMDSVPDDDNAGTDMHLLLNSILRFRLNIFKLLDEFQLIHMRDEANQFPYVLQMKSLNHEYLLLEARQL